MTGAAIRKPAGDSLAGPGPNSSTGVEGAGGIYILNACNVVAVTFRKRGRRRGEGVKGETEKYCNSFVHPIFIHKV